MKARFCVIGVILMMTASAHADTLVLTSGRRVQGQLIGVVGGDIEFEERTGLRRRTVRVAREEISRIEFDDESSSSAGPFNRDQPGTAIPRGMRERVVNVSGRERWNDSGIDVREGQSIYFNSSGEVRWGPRNRKDGAAGEQNSPTNHLRPIPDRPAAALIGRIGDGADVFFIGADSGPFRVRQTGRLHLGINDDWLEDNTGSLSVKVLY